MMSSSVRQRGFTLIEMIAVVLIVALLATLAGVSLHGAYNRASFDDVAQRVIRYDAGARDFARRFGSPLQLELGEHGIVQHPIDQEHEERAARLPFHLPQPYTLTPVGDAAEVRISADGRSRTYAVCLQGPTGRRQWILFAGLTGRSSLLDNEAHVDDILAALAAPRLPEPEAVASAGGRADAD